MCKNMMDMQSTPSMGTLGGPQGTQSPESATMGAASPQGLQVTGPQPGTPGLIPPANLGMYGKKKNPAAQMQRGPTMPPGNRAMTGFEYRPQQIFSQEYGPGPLSGGLIGDYMRMLSGNEPPGPRGG